MTAFASITLGAFDLSPLSTPTLSASQSSTPFIRTLDVDAGYSPTAELIATPDYQPIPLALPPSALSLPAPAKRLSQRKPAPAPEPAPAPAPYPALTAPMSEGSSHKGRHLRRGEQLRRNAACTSCRQRRTKCDAAKPACSACVRHHAYLQRTQPDAYPDGHVVQCCYDDEVSVGGTPLRHARGLHEVAPPARASATEDGAEPAGGPSRSIRGKGRKVKRVSRSRESESSDAREKESVTDLIARVAELQAELVSRESVPSSTTSTSTTTPILSADVLGVPLELDMGTSLDYAASQPHMYGYDDTFDPFAFSLDQPLLDSPGTFSSYADLLSTADASFGGFQSTGTSTIAPTCLSPTAALTSSALAPGSIPLHTSLFPPAPPAAPAHTHKAYPSPLIADRRASVPLPSSMLPRLQQCQTPLMLPFGFGAPLVSPADYTYANANAPPGPLPSMGSMTYGPGSLDPSLTSSSSIFSASAQLFQQAVDSVRPHSLEEVLRMRQMLCPAGRDDVAGQAQPDVHLMGMGVFAPDATGKQAPAATAETAGMMPADGLGLTMINDAGVEVGINGQMRARNSV